jgi:hypothetical protein
MPTNAAIAYSSTFGIWNGASYTNVAEVTNITPPQYTRDAIEATHHASPNSYREYIPGMIDGGEVSIEINYVPSNADVIIAALQSSSAGQFRITHANGVSVTFSAVVTGYSPETPIDGKMSATATFKVSGRPTWA